MTDALQWLDDAARARERAGLTRALVPVSGDGLLDLAGNDYLGLRTHPAVIAGAVDATRRYGGGAGASRLVTGTLPVHADLEASLADLAQVPTALVTSTGYAANLAVLSALAGPGTLVVSDAHAHASLIDGMRLARAEVTVAPHNDVTAVEQALASRAAQRALVVAESIYSVLGDLAPLVELVEVTRRHGALLVVDEAHALGVLGACGGGALAALGLAGEDHVIVTGTLSKALGSQGGVVLAHRAVREHLVNTARPFIYDTGLAPAAAGAALAASQLVRGEDSLRGRLRANAARLAAACGVGTPPGAVMSVPMPGPSQALAAVAEAAGHGIRIGCFRPPSTPDGDSRLRLTAHADHSDAELAQAAGVLAEVIAHHG